MQTAERLNALMDHLGLEAAFFATQVPGDVADLAGGGRNGSRVSCFACRCASTLGRSNALRRGCS